MSFYHSYWGSTDTNRVVSSLPTFSSGGMRPVLTRAVSKGEAAYSCSSFAGGSSGTGERLWVVKR